MKVEVALMMMMMKNVVVIVIMIIRHNVNYFVAEYIFDQKRYRQTWWFWYRKASEQVWYKQKIYLDNENLSGFIWAHVSNHLVKHTHLINIITQPK